MYRILGDAVATVEARELAKQLVAWHDAMVKHVRAVSMRGAACEEGCPHEQARVLWAQALDVFGPEADKLLFLRKHGERPVPSPSRSGVEVRA